MQTRSYVFYVIALTVTVAAALPILAASVTPANAATLVNLDRATYQVDVTIDDAITRHELAPGKSLAGFCPNGCVIRLDGNPESAYILEGRERVSIERGLVYYDGEEAPEKTDVKPAEPAN